MTSKAMDNTNVLGMTPGGTKRTVPIVPAVHSLSFPSVDKSHDMG